MVTKAMEVANVKAITEAAKPTMSRMIGINETKIDIFKKIDIS